MRSLLLPVLLCTFVLAGCAAQGTDEQRIRFHYGIPATARTVQSQVTPAEAGWFGREGLKITIVFKLSEGDVKVMANQIAVSGNWQPLPIPETTLEHLANIRSAREARIRLAQNTGEPLPPEGSVYNPTAGQLMQQFRQAMPAQPASGWYQISTAGNDILRAPKTVRNTLHTDVNDFMLATLDPAQRTFIVRVSTNY
jgi:hypothetical protein